MKSAAAIFSLGYLASHVHAAPSAGLELFKLKVASSAKDLDGHYLAANASTLGIFRSDEVSPIRVYQTGSAKQGCKQLHTYPIGIVDHALALVGSDGLMTLTDMVNPAGRKPPEGQAVEWDAFRVEKDSRLTNDGQGSWVVFPTAKNSWTVKWTDGSAFMTTDYMPVEIMMEPAGEGHYNQK